MCTSSEASALSYEFCRCGSGLLAAPAFVLRRGLDAVGVGAPGLDVLLDRLGVEVFSNGFADEGGQFCVGSKAEGDELAQGDPIDEGMLGGGKQGGEAKTLFQANDAVLIFGGVAAGEHGPEQEDDGKGDQPEMEEESAMSLVDGYEEGDGKVEQEEDAQDEERRISAGVVTVCLGRGHEGSYQVGAVSIARRALECVVLGGEVRAVRTRGVPGDEGRRVAGAEIRYGFAVERGGERGTEGSAADILRAAPGEGGCGEQGGGEGEAGHGGGFEGLFGSHAVFLEMDSLDPCGPLCVLRGRAAEAG
jgi:hypothetical protein